MPRLGARPGISADRVRAEHLSTLGPQTPRKSRGQLIDIVVEPDAVMLPMMELMIGVNADHE